MALVLARGAANREAAGELFVSLRHVHRKFGIRSRAELGRVFAARPSSSPTYDLIR